MINHYIKSFFNSVKKNRFFYSINLFGFLTGFLLLTVIFTFVYQELSFDSFQKKADQIYRIHSGGYGVTPMCFAEKLKNQIPEIKHIVRFNSTNLTLVHNNGKFKVDKCYFTDAEVFQVFSFQLLSGDANSVLKNPFSIVINQSTASKIFGKNSPIGETIKDKSGKSLTITGVMEDIPYNSHIRASAFLSVETLRQMGDESAFNCGSWDILTYLCLSEHANSNETEKKINALLEDSKMGSKDGKMWLKLQPFKKVYFDATNNKYDGCRHANMLTLAMYLAISVLILVIVIINYINLSISISSSRIKEFAIRKVNGAERPQIIKQIVMEALCVVFISFMVALIIIELLLPSISTLLSLPISDQVNRSILYLYYFLSITVIGTVTGLVPGLFLAKTDETKALKNEMAMKSKGTLRKLLLGFQLLMVAVLLNSSFIVTKQIGYVLDKDLGFHSENVIYLNLDKTLQDKPDLLKSILLKNPKIQNISFADGLMGDGFAKTLVNLDSTKNLSYFYSIDPDYLDLYQIKIKYGRNFSRDFPTDFGHNCLVNEEFCRKFGIENPVNKIISGRTIVGVVNDFNFISLRDQIEPLMLNCINGGKVAQIKIAADATDEILSFIKTNCKNISPNYDDNYSFLDARLRQLYHSELDLKRSFEIYSAVTFLIALLGLLGLTMFMIRKRSKESGIRKLFGARVTNTFILFTKEQIWIVTISNLLAVPFSYLIMNRWLSGFHYRTTIGLSVFLGSFLITLVVTLLATAFLILKTHKANLIETLKHE